MSEKWVISPWGKSTYEIVTTRGRSIVKGVRGPDAEQIVLDHDAAVALAASEARVARLRAQIQSWHEEAERTAERAGDAGNMVSYHYNSGRAAALRSVAVALAEAPEQQPAAAEPCPACGEDKHITLCTKNAHTVSVLNAHVAAGGIPVTCPVQQPAGRVEAADEGLDA